MGIKKEGVQANSTENIFNKTIAESFQNLGEEMVIQIQEAFRMLKQTKPEKNFSTSYNS
jgi:hypothetical protein